ncbi:MAG TPA: aminomethyl-transferring glycine dehydrogenase subunit GcvPB [Candidatus Omnitrophota bacterium]|nr:aminomethyl-transferring glycine dehydrogenase subunit GcvPB [Candidatus Omnitrophota bacterium]HRZ15502.1 aminomethyl-transferring glycine dehydrogenase subunit GcvPB [Candidatus Omnitrophota bacterium]
MRLIFENSVAGRCGFKVAPAGVAPAHLPEKKYVRARPPELPEVSEVDVVRHFTNLSRLNFSVDTNFYPLGSCTMKYNPKFAEKIAAMEGFTDAHPLLPQLSGGGILAQGSLEVLYQMDKLLSEITGMAAFTMQPLAGAHGELTGVMLIAAYHKHNGARRKYVIVPDSSHGTNPASAAIAGYEVIVIPTDKNGYMDMQEYKSKLTEEVAAVMLTCPDTLGIFNPKIKEIADLAHGVGALMYYDGANLNAIMGKCRPGDLGFDVVHVNLHKTFGTPHGGGGPGAGPVGVCEKLLDFLPISRVVRRQDGTYMLDYTKRKTIGYIAPFYGNFGVILKAYAYILFLGKSGLIEASETAVLNANYCRASLKDRYESAYDKPCMHECVFSASRQTEHGVHALDIAKFLIDRGIHPPTIYFPLIVKEALMIEPTETESRETLDAFIRIMIEIARLAQTDPERIKEAPLTTPVKRLDETKAARELDLCWKSKS